MKAGAPKKLNEAMAAAGDFSESDLTSFVELL